MKLTTRTLFATFMGPAACGATEVTSYALVRPVASTGARMALGLPIAIGAAVSIVGLALSLRALRGGDKRDVDRFVAIAGLVVNAFFLVVIVVGFGLPALFVLPTD